MPDLTPQQQQWMTVAFVAAVTIVVLGYDMLVYQAYGCDATISRVFGRFFRRNPVAFAAFCVWVGILVGHLLLPAD